ncbi:hypothetical protein PtA15_2A183 [Puccinia triticina]|uniref:Uncharacterized protein n=1 Tax=Puccinia triticina TaxID=208348 RepID=A0ABY7CAQ5_9BASI|nr:uncharacterized protein PtA15_2A183 [Puccinia triticina]WAQ81870.1 hypothetical protein PtA15_2A183 [Puccinia triticina]WAR52756.1 hypothetical protein PtB15_2B181 [Puccinia triticina]
MQLASATSSETQDQQSEFGKADKKSPVACMITGQDFRARFMSPLIVGLKANIGDMYHQVTLAQHVTQPTAHQPVNAVSLML